MPVKILSTADLHIGRTPTRVPDAIRTQSSCARMWSAIVELAIREVRLVSASLPQLPFELEDASRSEEEVTASEA